MAVATRELLISGMGGHLGARRAALWSVCPFCNSNDKSFSLTRERTGFVYRCHRNSCKVKGYVRTEPMDADFKPG